MNRGRLSGLAAITITSVLWGTTGTAATFAPSAGPLAIGSAALGIGGLLQAAIAVPALRSEWTVLREQRWVVTIGAVAVALYPLAFYSSMHFAGVAVGSVVSLASAPLASGILERVVDRRPLSRWWMLAAVLGIVGSTLLCIAKIEDRASSSLDTILGIALGLVAGLTYATYSWASHRLMSGGISRGASMGAVFGGGGLLLMPVLVLTGASLLDSGQNLAVTAYMALVPMFLGYLLFGYGLTKVSASTATTVTLTEPAIATVLAVVIVGERLTALGWVGLAIIAGVLVILAAAPTNADPRTGAPEISRRRRSREQTLSSV
ncbi:threonine and homoserine efflux system [Microbacterium oxydans]|uniref:Threonine and homoserine efflux system n=1 Tax=Microbacterium oxydans TaxID=82380 RepID=A0A0F0KHY7_9MICO|nr:EamA family transporter [Microbacterium oxydans]KJL20473.1 threonine and homoserine efflux system [Microbacterium oxydans]